jgi:glutaredoxin domain-containing cysteine-rich protein 1
MGCVSSTFLEDDDRRIIGVSASSSTSHIVSLTSSTYGILTYNLTSDDHPKSTPPPPPPPPPPLSLPSRSKPKPPAGAQPEEEEAEVINSWELMAGLHDPTTPAKPKPTASPRRPTTTMDTDGKPPRCIRFPLRPIDGNVSAPTHAARPPPIPTPPPPPHRCPPGGAHCAVLYTTTLRALRDTFEACNAVRAALHSHGVAFRERDVSMDRGFRDELRALLLPLSDLPLSLPRLFVRGRHLGGAEEVLRMDEEGALGPLLDGLPRARPGGRCCDGCGGMRFLPCFDCSGSRKVVVAGAGVVAKGRRERGVLMRCGECNENGLVLCPICS